MIKNFLIINFTGKNDVIGLRYKNKFFKKRFHNKHQNNNDKLVISILELFKKNNIIVDKNFAILVNMGPGSFSSIRASFSVAKGIKISIGANIYGYKKNQLSKFNLENIEKLINKKKLENKLIKPIYLS
tara:strand:+ start:994 stop:1380 length:387 start_codon:yes stop_codon:yes gene_type:complete